MESDDPVKESTEELLQRLYPALRRFAAVVAPAEVLPDDLVQDALVALLRRGPVGEVDDPAAYLRRTMVNLASNHRRRLGRTRRVIARLVVDLQEPALDRYPSDLAHLAMLRPAARAVLYLQHVDGMPTQSIAAMLGMTDAAVRQVANRARRTLRDHLEGEGSDHD